MKALIELRTDRHHRLVGQLDPGSLRLYVRHRGETVAFDLLEIARSARPSVVEGGDPGAESGKIPLRD